MDGGDGRNLVQDFWRHIGDPYDADIQNSITPTIFINFVGMLVEILRIRLS